MDKVHYYEAQLDENLSTFPILKKLEAATKVPKTYTFLGVFFIVFFALLFDLGGSFFTNLIGWAIPAYYSFQALEEKETKDHSQWISHDLHFELPHPFYYLVKTAFLLWLLLPNYRGAEHTYRAALRPLYSRFTAFVNNLSDPDCPLPSMSDAANSLRASAASAASKLETAASETKETVTTKVSSAASAASNAAQGAVETATSAIKGDNKSAPAQELEKAAERAAEVKSEEKTSELKPPEVPSTEDKKDV
ncbi:ER membrane protein DP1/Yop1 [Massospora cicadina]|nr:ER membrane protein DP1/Yop1 [Massospora cicadina]